MKPLYRALALACLLLSLSAHAERADHDKPLQLEAQKMTVDDARKVQVLEGDVVLIKGSIIIRADRVIITEDQYGFQKGTAYNGPGGLARFRQKREGKDEYIEGEAERIEYNTRNEVAELFHRAYVKSGEDQVKGDYIWYDSIAEKYMVTAADTRRNPNEPPPRVRAVIQPKNKDTAPAAPATKGNTLMLQGAQGIQKLPD